MDRTPSRDGPCPRGEATNREEAYRQWKETPNASGAITDEAGDQDYLKEIRQKPADAELLSRECLTIREKKLPDPGAPGLFHTKSMLGGALAGQKNPGAPGRSSSKAMPG